MSWRFILVSNKRESYGRLKDGIRTKNIQRGDIERYKSMEHDKRISANEILRQNESWSLELKTKVETLLTLWDVVIILLKIDIQRVKTQKSKRLKIGKSCYNV